MKFISHLYFEGRRKISDFSGPQNIAGEKCLQNLSNPSGLEPSKIRDFRGNKSKL
ncbi:MULTISPECIES: hypothetical protein [Methanobacterium]|uniref:hypothetical protein n=1 Tax=Methanobacterium TaxID=2160 RepID=UPI0015B5DEE6|nr:MULTISPECIES: hypothetical protein [Methanobacterium]